MRDGGKKHLIKGLPFIKRLGFEAPFAGQGTVRKKQFNYIQKTLWKIIHISVNMLCLGLNNIVFLENVCLCLLHLSFVRTGCALLNIYPRTINTVLALKLIWFNTRKVSIKWRTNIQTFEPMVDIFGWTINP